MPQSMKSCTERATALNYNVMSEALKLNDPKAVMHWFMNSKLTMYFHDGTKDPDGQVVGSYEHYPCFEAKIKFGQPMLDNATFVKALAINFVTHTTNDGLAMQVESLRSGRSTYQENGLASCLIKLKTSDSTAPTDWVVTHSHHVEFSISGEAQWYTHAYHKRDPTAALTMVEWGGHNEEGGWEFSFHTAIYFHKSRLLFVDLFEFPGPEQVFALELNEPFTARDLDFSYLAPKTCALVQLAGTGPGDRKVNFLYTHLVGGSAMTVSVDKNFKMRVWITDPAAPNGHTHRRIKGTDSCIEYSNNSRKRFGAGCLLQLDKPGLLEKEMCYMAKHIETRTSKNVKRFVYTLLERIECKKAVAGQGDYSLNAAAGKPGHTMLREYTSWVKKMNKRFRTA
jgi:hypothetical protein